MGVIGKVGAGKSSLLAAITAEMEKRLGQVIFFQHSKLDFVVSWDFHLVISLIFTVLPSSKGLCKEPWRRIWLSCPGENVNVQYVVGSFCFLSGLEGDYWIGFHCLQVWSMFSWGRSQCSFPPLRLIIESRGQLPGKCQPGLNIFMY